MSKTRRRRMYRRRLAQRRTLALFGNWFESIVHRLEVYGSREDSLMLVGMRNEPQPGDVITSRLVR